MGSQTQQPLNGTNDIVMADGDTPNGGEDRQSATSSKANGDAGGNDNGEAGSSSSAAAGGEKEEKKVDDKATEAKTGGAAAAPAPPPPVLRGTLSYNVELKRHLIRGMWNYENSNALPPQRFELLRNLNPDEDPTELPKDGEFHGSFSLAYFHTTSKGKQKERSKVIPESGVKIKFTEIEGTDNEYKVDGTGTNQFGIFHINGTAKESPHGDGQYQIELRKRYEPSANSGGGGGGAAAAAADGEGGKKSKKRKMGSITSGTDTDTGPLPPPSQTHERNVVCLRGQLYKETSDELGGMGDIVHRIHGMWSSGLDLILADPQNVRGLCNRFEYEHKSSVPSSAFPVSGKYAGWFYLNLDDGKQKKINEKDVTLRFKKNNAGYHNVEGKGSNAFGKYTITGTLTQDNVITIFRHFAVRKPKNSRPVTSAPPPINPPGAARKASLPTLPEPQLKFDEVKAPEGSEPLEAITTPDNGTYSAVARGVLRLNEDGSHSCQGKWAVTREHLINGQTSNFAFRLESHFAADAVKNSDGRQFPLDSHLYKGSFQLKKGATRYQTIIDQQIVMKFRKNTTGAYNVYGRGVNDIGVFDLTGTLIMSGKSGGQVEVYRIYRPELLAAQAPAKTAAAQTHGKPRSDTLPGSELPPTTTSMGPSSSTMLPGPPRTALPRRESTRLVKVPSRLEDDDPKAQLSRLMDKCTVILRFIRDKDVDRGAFFSEPVDPVALGIPTYHQVISEPMDLRTLQRKMEAGEVTSPEEFARLARLVFENAMTFNVDPSHSVHQAARNLLILFNQKYRDVERMVANLRKSQKDTDGRKKGKDDKKRKRGEEPKSLRRRRLDEAQEMAANNTDAMNALLAAAPSGAGANVTRNEFNLMVQMMSQLQQQVVQTYTVLADSLSDDIESGPSLSAHEIAAAASIPAADAYVPPPEPKKPKATKAKPVEKPAPVEDDSSPLTLQEQELLTETINDLEPEHLHGVIQIIREAAKLTGEEDEIDLEIDQLDTATQRKLLRHVSKFIKQPKRQKVQKRKKAAPAPKKEKPAPAPKKTARAPAPAPAAKKSADSFFGFGANEDSDSDSDSEGEITSPVQAPAPAPEPAPAADEESGEEAEPPAPAAAAASKDNFNLNDGFGNNDDSDGSDDEEDDDEDGAAGWDISKPSNEPKSGNGGGGDEDGDDGWNAALKEAEDAKKRETDRKKREEKLKAEQEELKSKKMASAVEEMKAKKEALEKEEAEKARLREEKQKAEVKAAREAAQAQAAAVQQTVDLDAQREIMAKFEQNFMDKEMGGASPSSDFGF